MHAQRGIEMLYVAVVHKDAGSAYGVHFPDVPGCFSAADDKQGVVDQAHEALALYFEDEKPIKPRDLDAIRASGDVDQDLADGAILVLVPLTGPKQKRASRSKTSGPDRGAGIALGQNRNSKVKR